MDSGFNNVLSNITASRIAKAHIEFVGYRIKNRFTGEFKATFQENGKEYLLDQHQCEQIIQTLSNDCDRYKAAQEALKYWPK